MKQIRAITSEKSIRTLVRSLFSIFAVLTFCVVMSGCITGYPDYSLPTDVRSRSAIGRSEFSDETSRDLIRQTRKLIELQTRDYLVGPDDVLAVSIFEWEMTEETKTLDARVAESGVVSLPVLGSLSVGGKTLQEIQKLIENTLAKRKIMPNPRVAIDVKEYRSKRIGVIGAVNAPGQYAIHQNVSTLMDILTLAGGPAPDAGRISYILRKKRGDVEPLRILVDMEDLFEHGKFELNAVLQGGDIVYVPRAPLIYVYGSVSDPGGFALSRSMRILEALALAGGLNKKAATGSCKLIRKQKAGGRNTVNLNVSRIERGKDPNLFIQEGDVLFVPESRTKTIFAAFGDLVRSIFTFSYSLSSD